MTLRGGHGRTPGATDSRQGKARGEAYRTQATSGIRGVALIVGFVALLAVGVTLLADPALRGWGLAVLGLIVIAFAFRFWKRRRDRVSMKEAFTDLGE